MRKLKKYTFIVLLLGVLFLPFILLLFAFMIDTTDRTVIETKYGDKFELINDGLDKTRILQDTKSSFHYVFDGELSKKDIKELKQSSSLRVYQVRDIVIFDDGNGFEIFNESTDLKAHAEVAEVVKENLNCDEQFYKRYKKILEKQ
jgi:hypothetical protein